MASWRRRLSWAEPPPTIHLTLSTSGVAAHGDGAQRRGGRQPEVNRAGPNPARRGASEEEMRTWTHAEGRHVTTKRTQRPPEEPAPRTPGLGPPASSTAPVGVRGLSRQPAGVPCGRPGQQVPGLGREPAVHRRMPSSLRGGGSGPGQAVCTAAPEGGWGRGRGDEGRGGVGGATTALPWEVVVSQGRAGRPVLRGPLAGGQPRPRERPGGSQHGSTRTPSRQVSQCGGQTPRKTPTAKSSATRALNQVFSLRGSEEFLAYSGYKSLLSETCVANTVSSSAASIALHGVPQHRTLSSW